MVSRRTFGFGIDWLFRSPRLRFGGFGESAEDGGGLSTRQLMWQLSPSVLDIRVCTEIQKQLEDLCIAAAAQNVQCSVAGARLCVEINAALAKN